MPPVGEGVEGQQPKTILETIVDLFSITKKQILVTFFAWTVVICVFLIVTMTKWETHEFLITPFKFEIKTKSNQGIMLDASQDLNSGAVIGKSDSMGDKKLNPKLIEFINNYKKKLQLINIWSNPIISAVDVLNDEPFLAEDVSKETRLLDEAVSKKEALSQTLTAEASTTDDVSTRTEQEEEDGKEKTSLIHRRSSIPTYQQQSDSQRNEPENEEFDKEHGGETSEAESKEPKKEEFDSEHGGERFESESKESLKEEVESKFGGDLLNDEPFVREYNVLPLTGSESRSELDRFLNLRSGKSRSELARFLTLRNSGKDLAAKLQDAAEREKRSLSETLTGETSNAAASTRTEKEEEEGKDEDEDEDEDEEETSIIHRRSSRPTHQHQSESQRNEPENEEFDKEHGGETSEAESKEPEKKEFDSEHGGETSEAESKEPEKKEFDSEHGGERFESESKESLKEEVESESQTQTKEPDEEFDIEGEGEMFESQRGLSSPSNGTNEKDQV